jgi:AcrR family transcriptional regulator
MKKKRRLKPRRDPLSRERVVETAIALADDHGVDALTMRRLGSALGVEAMSLYHHVSNKDDVLEECGDRLRHPQIRRAGAVGSSAQVHGALVEREPRSRCGPGRRDVGQLLLISLSTGRSRQSMSALASATTTGVHFRTPHPGSGHSAPVPILDEVG